MNKFYLLIFTLLHCVTTSSMAAPPNIMESQSTASELNEANGVVKTIVNSTFSFGSLYSQKNDSFMDVLLAKKIKSTTISGREGTISTFEVIALAKDKGKYNRTLWKIKNCADSGSRYTDFYQTTKSGCCGAEELHRAYNFKTGKYVFSYTTEPASVDIIIPKDKIKRYISYVSIMGASSQCWKNDLPSTAIGALTISDGKTQIERLLIESNDRELAWSPKISLINNKNVKGVSNISVWPTEFTSKSEAIKGFSVKLFFYDGMEIIIPILKGRFNIEDLPLPKSIRVQKIAVE